MNTKKTAAAIVAATCTLAVAGCGSESFPDGELEPGQWQIEVGVTDFDLPDATPDELELAQISAGVGDLETQEQCMGPAEARIALEELPETLMEGIGCTMQDYSVESGQLSGNMSCEMPGIDTPVEYALSGTYSPQEFTLVMDAQMESANFPGGTARMEMTATASRTGDCE